MISHLDHALIGKVFLASTGTALDLQGNVVLDETGVAATALNVWAWARKGQLYTVPEDLDSWSSTKTSVERDLDKDITDLVLSEASLRFRAKSEYVDMGANSNVRSYIRYVADPVDERAQVVEISLCVLGASYYTNVQKNGKVLFSEKSVLPSFSEITKENVGDYVKAMHLERAAQAQKIAELEALVSKNADLGSEIEAAKSVLVERCVSMQLNLLGHSNPDTNANLRANLQLTLKSLPLTALLLQEASLEKSLSDMVKARKQHVPAPQKEERGSNDKIITSANQF